MLPLNSGRVRCRAHECGSSALPSWLNATVTLQTSDNLGGWTTLGQRSGNNAWTTNTPDSAPLNASLTRHTFSHYPNEQRFYRLKFSIIP